MLGTFLAVPLWSVEFLAVATLFRPANITYVGISIPLVCSSVYKDLHTCCWMKHQSDELSDTTEILTHRTSCHTPNPSTLKKQRCPQSRNIFSANSPALMICQLLRQILQCPLSSTNRPGMQAAKPKMRDKVVENNVWVSSAFMFLFEALHSFLFQAHDCSPEKSQSRRKNHWILCLICAYHLSRSYVYMTESKFVKQRREGKHTMLVSLLFECRVHCWKFEFGSGH